MPRVSRRAKWITTLLSSLLLVIVMSISSVHAESRPIRELRQASPHPCPSAKITATLQSHHRFAALLPSARLPNALMICLYSSIESGRTVSAEALIKGRSVIRPIVRNLRNLPVAPSGHLPCPNDDGSRLFIRASYGADRSILMVGHRSGCRLIYGTRSHKTFTLTTAVRAELEALARR